MIFDCAASLSMFGNKEAFIGNMVLLPTPVMVKLGSDIIKATLGGIARINIPRSDSDEDKYWSFYVFGIYVTFTDPGLILLSSHYLSYLGLGELAIRARLGGTSICLLTSQRANALCFASARPAPMILIARISNCSAVVPLVAHCRRNATAFTTSTRSRLRSLLRRMANVSSIQMVINFRAS